MRSTFRALPDRWDGSSGDSYEQRWGYRPEARAVTSLILNASPESALGRPSAFRDLCLSTPQKIRGTKAGTRRA